MSLTLRFENAEVLKPEGWTTDSVGVADGILNADADGRAVDLSGYRLLPGMIDLHGDGFERHVAPRRGAMLDPRGGIASVEAELASSGITTAYLAQFWSWEGGMRGPDFARKVFAAISDLKADFATDLRIQLRLETHLLSEFAAAEAELDAHDIDYLVFNDHLQHDRLADGRRPKQLNGQALKSGRSPERHLEYMQSLHALGPDVPAALDALADRLRARGVRLGSHDDSTRADRDQAKARGVTIAEFPETFEAAEAAKAMGDGVVMGAPNVMRGASHKGNVSAIDLVGAGLCDALASDYHYQSLGNAALKLIKDGVCDWATGWALVSSGPARIMGLDDRGAIAEGKRADLVVLDQNNRIAAALAGGQVSYMRGGVAERFFG